MSGAVRRATSGIYQPRSRGAAINDALAEARQALSDLTKSVVLRGAGGLLFIAGLAAIASLATYSPDDASLNNATGAVVRNWLGPLGATAADLLLQQFGIAALAFLAPPMAWGAGAWMGRSLKYALWRAFAWPLGRVFVAAGLGVLPRPQFLPAGAGGWIGIAAAALSEHAGSVYRQPGLGVLMPLFLLVAGLPLAFLATGLRFKPLARAAANVPAALWWLGTKIQIPKRQIADEPAEHEADDEDVEEFDSEPDEDSSGYHRDIAPEPIAATRLAERRENRIKREAAQKPAVTPKRERQPALHLESSEHQLPALGLLAEPVTVHDAAGLSDDALEENARMLEAVLAEFGLEGRMVGVRPGPVVTLYEFQPPPPLNPSPLLSLSS